MSQRIVLLGEGERDIGKIRDGRRHPPCDFEGDLPRLLRRLADLAGGRTVFGYDAYRIRDIVSKIPRGGRPMRAGGKGKELRDAVLSVLRHERPLALVALIDARQHEVILLRRDMADILEQCESEARGTPVALGLAIQEIEIWMLADPHARQAAFGAAVAQSTIADLEAELERADDPKRLWESLAGQASLPQDRDVDLFRDDQRSAAWATLRPEVVAHCCPQGFQPFHAAAQRLISQVLCR